MDKKFTFYILLGLVIGAFFGQGIGATNGNAFLGLGIGALIGVCIGWFLSAIDLRQG
ncbi:MAG TPA: hypothetical protein VFQ23_16340 [Anaerolineales bacterium]|nr:hypothetical protein [Anaerolineales bacterium]